jgi:hypothetical protein
MGHELGARLLSAVEDLHPLVVDYATRARRDEWRARRSHTERNTGIND